MKYGSSVHQNSRVSSYPGSSIEAIGKQSPTPGDAARSVVRLSYWLVVLVLGLTSASVAQATPVVSEDRIGTVALGGGKTEVAKAPKPYPSHFPTLTADSGAQPLSGYPTEALPPRLERYAETQSGRKG